MRSTSKPGTRGPKLDHARANQNPRHDWLTVRKPGASLTFSLPTPNTSPSARTTVAIPAIVPEHQLLCRRPPTRLHLESCLYRHPRVPHITPQLHHNITSPSCRGPRSRGCPTCPV